MSKPKGGENGGDFLVFPSSQKNLFFVNVGKIVNKALTATAGDQSFYSVEYISAYGGNSPKKGTKLGIVEVSEKRAEEISLFSKKVGEAFDSRVSELKKVRDAKYEEAYQNYQQAKEEFFENSKAQMISTFPELSDYYNSSEKEAPKVASELYDEDGDVEDEENA